MERSPMLVDWQNQHSEIAILPKVIYMLNACFYLLFNKIRDEGRTGSAWK
jgi:hypothetical protein